jgi:C1A family cysteine protease
MKLNRILSLLVIAIFLLSGFLFTMDENPQLKTESIINNELQENPILRKEYNIDDDSNEKDEKDNHPNEENLKPSYGYGYIPPSDDFPSEPLPEIIAAPSSSSWDWRDHEGHDFTTSVKSQGGCGSCWAFAALGALESIIKIEENAPNLDIDLSEQYLLSCPPNSGGCRGWNSISAYGYLENNGGIIPESCFPYEADDEIPCSAKCNEWEDYLIPIESAKYYDSTSENFVKNKIIDHGPVVTSMVVYSDFDWYSGGIYEHPGSEENQLTNHAVVIVGFNDNPGYWICKNSWGPSWGENGYFKIAYGDCKIADSMTVVEYDADEGNIPPSADAGEIKTGHVGDTITFTGVATDADDNIESYRWDFGDGTFSSELQATHRYSTEGKYMVTFTVTDDEGIKSSDSTIAYIDDTPPVVEIRQPKEKKFYFYGTELFSLPFKTRILGGVDVQISIEDEVSDSFTASFYLDDTLMYSDEVWPYHWDWEDSNFGRHTIKVEVSDLCENTESTEIDIWRIF